MKPGARYYGFVSAGRGRWTELLVTADARGRMAQTPTGVTYPTAKDASDGVAERNIGLTRRLR